MSPLNMCHPFTKRRLLPHFSGDLESLKSNDNSQLLKIHNVTTQGLRGKSHLFVPLILKLRIHLPLKIDFKFPTKIDS